MATCNTNENGSLSGRRQWYLSRLAHYGVTTIGDLDTWRNSRRWKDDEGEYIPSRHLALTAMLDEDAAIEILSNLAILQCTLKAPTVGQALRAWLSAKA